MLNSYILPVDECTDEPNDNWHAFVMYNADTEIMPVIINLNTGEDMIKWYLAKGGKERLQTAVDGFASQIESGKYDYEVLRQKRFRQQ